MGCGVVEACCTGRDDRARLIWPGGAEILLRALRPARRNHFFLAFPLPFPLPLPLPLPVVVAVGVGVTEAPLTAAVVVGAAARTSLQYFLICGLPPASSSNRLS